MSVSSFQLCVSIAISGLLVAGARPCAGSESSTTGRPTITTPGSDWMTDADRARVELLISTLNDDDLETRESAARSLTAMGGSVEDFLAQRIAHPPEGSDPAVGFCLQGVLESIRGQHAQAELNAALEDLKRAAELGPAAYLPADRALEKALSQTSVTFSFVDTSLDGVVDFFRDEAHVPLLLDPVLAAQGPANLNLRVCAMSADLALEWVARLHDAEIVKRGKYVVITTKSRAEQLCMKEETIRLADRGDSPGWTLQQTTALTDALKTWTGITTGNVKAGQFEIQARDARIEQIKDFVMEQDVAVGEAKPGGAVRFIGDTQGLYLALKRQTDFVYDKGERLGIFGAGIENVAVGAKLDALAKESCALSNIDYFTVAEHLAEAFELSPTIGQDDRIALVAPQEIRLPVRGAIVDLRPALKAGVAEQALRTQIEAIVSQSKTYATDAEMRGWGPGRAFVSLDFWTALRIEAFIRDMSRTGKITELPALPPFLTHSFVAPVPEPAKSPGEAARKIADE